MTSSIESTTTLSNDVEMPWLGLGVYLAKSGQEATDAVQWAVEGGYRHVDTAAFYRNEADVAEGIRRSGVPREEVFVTSKVWNDDQGYTETLRACDRSLAELGYDYVDLYLVHWPMPSLMEETWRAVETIYREGKARAIGVSNFLVHHLERLLEFAEEMPAVNQVELHPHLQQPALQAFCRTHDIALTAWSPLKKGEVVDMPEIVEIARIDGLDRNERTGPHPDFFP